MREIIRNLGSMLVEQFPFPFRSFSFIYFLEYMSDAPEESINLYKQSIILKGIEKEAYHNLVLNQRRDSKYI